MSTNVLLTLLKTRRLWPLVLAQSCGALNDNLVKNAMVVLAIFKLGAGGAGLSAAAGALFIAPYILVSATAGKIADRYAKPIAIRIYKIAEVGLMLAAAAAFLAESVPALLTVLVGLGIQAALFGPVKYGILPEQLEEHELVGGNGVIEATTFLSIVLGTVAGGALVLLPGGTAIVGAVGVILSLVGLFGALRIPPVPVADPSLTIGWNIASTTWIVLRQASKQRPIWLSLLALSWFWTIGATLLTEFPIVARDTLGSGGSVLTLLLAVFALGTGVGSIGCAKLLHGDVSPRHVPFAAFGISLFCWDFARAAAGAGVLPDAWAMLESLAGWRMLADLALLAACGGVFSVPLYAIIQDSAAPGERSRMIAANNVMNALFMVAGAGAAAGLAAAGFSAPSVLKIAASANLAVACWIVRILPEDVVRSVFRWYFNSFHGVDVVGLDNYKAAGERVVIVSNHQSYADACLIAAFLPDSPTFAIHTGQASKWWVKPFIAAVDVFPVDVQTPYALKRMVEAVRDHGRKLMIFPEGRMTRTGALMKVYEGAGLVADKAHAKILPVAVEGLQFTHMGRMGGRQHLRWFPRLKLTILPPVDLTPPDAETLTHRKRREAIGRALQDVMVDAVFRSKNVDRTLFAAFLDARHANGGKTPIAEDIQRQPLDYNRLLLGAMALGRRLDSGFVGVMLPNANATVATFLGLQAFGRVPCMLNFSAGADAMLSACVAAGVKTVVSSRAFVEKAKLTAAVGRMATAVRFVWLEDVRASIGLGAKLRAKCDALFARRLSGAVADPNTPAVVLFTSGSEGRPKGVVLSHRQLLSNVAQLSSVIDFNGGDILFNAMPVFHSFGLTGGTIVPLLSGVRTFHYPSPLHYRIVPGLIYDTDATICFGTDTFLNGWARFAHPYDFYAMRYIFAGAEKVRDETKRLFADRFGVRILEGYGATETAPALAINTAMHCRPGTVGRFLPGIEWKLEPVLGVDHGGRLFVRGPNVMLRYVRDVAPGVLVTLDNGWYDTGDIVDVDAQGFVCILGRAKRFAKIGGEMVSMTAAEALVAAVWPGEQLAVVAVPDARKGEQLLLVIARADADVRELLVYARSKGISELVVPRAILKVKEVPLLGTGKIDYPAVAALAVA